MMDRWLNSAARSHARALVLLFSLSFLMFLPGLFALQPMDRDEPRFAQASKQMLETGDYVDIRFQDEARHKKPVGIYWLQSASVKAAEKLGFADAASVIGYYRIPSFLAAIAAILLTYWVGLVFLSRPGAFLAAAIMASCILMGVEARLAKTDATLTATVLAAMGALARVYLPTFSPAGSYRPGLGNALIFWIAIGVGVLIKGPVTFAIVALAALVLSFRARNFRWLKQLRPGMGFLVVAAIALPWLVAIGIKSGGAFFAESVGKDMLGKVSGAAEKHWGPPGAYFIAFWATFWPAAPMAALAGLFAWRERSDDAVAFLLAWFLPMYVVLEALPTKLPHYMLPMYPALAVLIVLALERNALPQDRWRVWISAFLMALIPVGLLVGAPLAFLKMDGSLPIPLMALLLIGTVIALLGVRAQLNRRPVAALAAGILAMLPIGTAAFQYGMPGLETINLSRRLADASRAVGCSSPKITTAGYREPSLVFLTNTALDMSTGDSAAVFLTPKAGECRIALVESREEELFRKVLTEKSLNPALASRVTGLNINGGRKLDIGIWVSR